MHGRIYIYIYIYIYIHTHTQIKFSKLSLKNDNMIKPNTTRQSFTRHRTIYLLSRPCTHNYINNRHSSDLHNNQNGPK